MKNTKYTLFPITLVSQVALIFIYGCQCDQIKLINDTWVLEKYGSPYSLKEVIPGTTPPAESGVVLQMSSENTFSGSDGCNMISGMYKANKECQIQFESIQSTLILCQDDIAQQANAINILLRKVNSYAVTANRLELIAPDKEVMQYRKR